MNSILDAICLSISIEEGEPISGTLADICHNPGNLIFAKQPNATPHPVVGKDGKTRTYAAFPTRAQGWAALYWQVAERIREGFTLRKLICDPVSGWAPQSDGNQPSTYLAAVLAGVAKHAAPIGADVALWEYLPPATPTPPTPAKIA